MTTWIKVFNTMPQNPKLLIAGDRAAWMFVCGLCYSNEHLTNGLIPRHALPVVAPGVKVAEALAKRLVTAGLWHEVDGGWQIHDYTEHQRSADEIRERRSRDAARKAAARSDRTPYAVREESARTHSESPHRVHDVDVDVEGREQKADTSDAAGADEKFTDDDRRLCRLLAELATDRNPKFKVKSPSRWLNDMRLLRDRDSNDPAEIEDALRWVFRHSFWGGVIQSPGNLREHFGQIWDQMGRTNVVALASQAGEVADLDAKRVAAMERLKAERGVA